MTIWTVVGAAVVPGVLEVDCSVVIEGPHRGRLARGAIDGSGPMIRALGGRAGQLRGRALDRGHRRADDSRGRCEAWRGRPACRIVSLGMNFVLLVTPRRMICSARTACRSRRGARRGPSPRPSTRAATGSGRRRRRRSASRATDLHVTQLRVRTRNAVVNRPDPTPVPRVRTKTTPSSAGPGPKRIPRRPAASGVVEDRHRPLEGRLERSSGVESIQPGSMFAADLVTHVDSRPTARPPDGPLDGTPPAASQPARRSGRSTSRSWPASTASASQLAAAARSIRPSRRPTPTLIPLPPTFDPIAHDRAVVGPHIGRHRGRTLEVVALMPPSTTSVAPFVQRLVGREIEAS